VSHGSLAVPSGVVPCDDKADPKQLDRPECVSHLQFEVLFINVQGPVCIPLYDFATLVPCCVLLLPN
jgi:hypothetical protein